MISPRAALCGAALFAFTAPAAADAVRVATFNVELQRDGPGLLLRDLNRGNDPRIDAVIQVIAKVAPDILAIQGLDWDYDNAALNALCDQLAQSGALYPHRLSLQPNSGLATDLDLDGDGRFGGAGDAQGFGQFTGQGGLAVLSRYPVLSDQVRNLSDVLWRDLPDALLPSHQDGSPFPSGAALDIQRLSSTGHWVVPIEITENRTLHVLTFQAGPPVFDGPEDRNGRRNHDEILLWQSFLDGQFGPSPQRFVLAGGANLDPFDSDGRTVAIRTLLADQRLQDPTPVSRGAAMAPDQGHRTPNALDTVDWDGPGRLRVDYVLPSAGWTVVDAGVFWPAPDEDHVAAALTASRHRLVWVDLALD